MPTQTKKKRTIKKTVGKTKKAPVAPVKKAESFSQDFTNALLVMFAVGMMLFAYVIYTLY